MLETRGNARPVEANGAARPTTKRTGTLEGPFKDASGRLYYCGKVRLRDGSRTRVEIPEGKRYSEKPARNYLEWAQGEEDRDGTLYAAKLAGRRKREASTKGAPGETCDAWYARFAEYRRQEVGSVDDDRARWTKWIAPHIGPKPIRDVTPDDVENVRDALNAAVLAYEAAGNAKGEGRLAPKSALHMWSCLTVAMKYASTRKGPRELRVREDLGNPCLGIPPPRDGVSKRRHWLRPDDFVKLIGCERVPREWREAYAIGLYLHLRPGELHELRVRDLDLVAGEVRIERAYDERTRTVTTPKTDEGIRTVTIPPTLLPLLERIARERTADDRVVPVVAASRENSRGQRSLEKSRAETYRAHLEIAGVDGRHFVETATHLPIDFRSLRDSGITWRFLAEHRSEVVQRESGHEHIATTLGYAKEVQNRGGRYGAPFPALPAELTRATEPPAPVTSVRGLVRARSNSARQLSGRRGSKVVVLETAVIHARPQKLHASRVPAALQLATGRNTKRHRGGRLVADAGPPHPSCSSGLGDQSGSHGPSHG